MRALGGYQASRKQNASGCFYISISKVCRPIFQTVSWVQRNEVIISNLKVHWRRSISRLSVHDNTAAKIFVPLSVQGLFFFNASPSSSAPFRFPKVLCFRSSLIGAFSPKTRPGNPSKCEFVIHFDEFLG